MKSILLALAVSFSFYANAGEPRLVPVEAPTVVAQVANVSQTIKSIQLKESGILEVTNMEGAQQSMILSKSNLATLLGYARVLASAEIVTDHRLIVCMMAINPYTLRDLSVRDEKTNELRLTLTSGGCAIPDYTHPKQDYMMAIAQELRVTLVALAQQLVNE
jgi:hypothetical protein